ncbi:TIGR01457 family HAD-type hydrolase [Paenibacillus sp. F411]|uniref:TIGR01457 family HAD-type hydrolase n=1 Tax=Paenibacillus sp. F411 TaxID=2820239 RepID=UPI001AAF8A76|nr:TIGR01457 family HAD-type hydrolase [Paenibacillus sp. F411]MBO2943038.1 TIGR01457 family HAD-type hydrolase [Paenibacillus sp. F411]
MSIHTTGILIDLDGTLYHGKRRIPGADQFVSRLRERQLPFLFVTNNSSRTPEQVADHLKEMGIDAAADEVCTSSLAAASYISRESPGAKVAILGEEGLHAAIEQAGLQVTEDQPDYCVQGIYRSFSYDSLARAVQWIHGGAVSVLTNPDLLLPSDDGLSPGAGSLGAAIEAASGVKPIVIGKPSSILMNYAADRLGISPRQAVVVGDNMRTDIAAGAQAGCKTILVMTGITTPYNIEEHRTSAGVSPDYICETLSQAADLLCSGELFT